MKNPVFNILGDPSRMIQESMIFNVQKCSDDEDVIVVGYEDGKCAD